MNGKIAYLSHVPWKAIKQRPQFLAEQLAKDYSVVYLENKGASTLVHRNKTPDTSKIKSGLFIKRMLWINHYKIKNKIEKTFSKLVNCFLIKRISTILRDCEYIWITHPSKFAQFKGVLPVNAKVIYDCMDDALEFENYYIPHDELFLIEDELIKRADFVFCSSNYLQSKLISRFNLNKEKSIVVNNAVELPTDTHQETIPEGIQKIMDTIKGSSYPIVYFGAISHWFDFDIIINLLEKVKDINLILIGPRSVEIPEDNRIRWYEPIERKYIFNIMPLAFSLAMPFKVNELIKSVNPVKLYEYIFSGKPVIAPRYGESEKFDEFAYLYSNDDELYEIVEGLQKNTITAKPIERCMEFARNNTWNARYSEIKGVIEKL